MSLRVVGICTGERFAEKKERLMLAVRKFYIRKRG